MRLLHHHTHVGLGVAQHQAAGLGEHQGIDVAAAALLQVETLAREGDVAVLLQVVGVDDDAVVGHVDLVEDLAQHHIEGAKLAAQLREVDAPLHHVVAGGHHLAVVHLVEAADEAAAAYEHLALAAGVAGEGLAHEIDDAVLVEGVFAVVKLLASLKPHAAGEHDVFFLGRVPQLAFHPEEERLLHAQAHVVDGGLLLVGHAPVHLFA